MSIDWLRRPFPTTVLVWAFPCPAQRFEPLAVSSDPSPHSGQNPAVTDSALMGSGCRQPVRLAGQADRNRSDADACGRCRTRHPWPSAEAERRTAFGTSRVTQQWRGPEPGRIGRGEDPQHGDL